MQFWLRSAFSFLLILMVSALSAQNIRLTGKVLGDKNDPLVGVNVKVTATGKTVLTNVEGRYTVELTAGQKYEIEFSAVGYETKIISDIEVKNGAANELNIIMAVKSKELEGVVVSSRRTGARMETVSSTIAFQKNTNTVASVVSAETIRRSPDKNTGEVLKRTPGASLQDGKFLVVRGLADRYNTAMLNGILLTSTEPDRKTFAFNLIPSAIIDNIVINKAFVPEFPGEWSGGLIQVNTKDIPARSFMNIQIGTGFNAQTIGRDFYKSQAGGLDWLGIDDGTRALPASYKTKTQFDQLTREEKIAIGKALPNSWVSRQTTAPLDMSLQINGGINTRLFGKQTGITLGVLYNKSNRFQKLLNRQNTYADDRFDINFSYNDNRYNQEVTVGAIAGASIQLNSKNKISVKSILNVNTNNYVTNRDGNDYLRTSDVMANEFTFKQNTFFTSQLIGEHSISAPLKFKWYGSFNILDAQSPDQKRIQYSRASGTQDPYSLLVGNSLSQESGSRIFQDLSDYIYTAGGDLSYNYKMLGQKQTVKGGYMLQVKDRLYDAKLFANYLPRDNAVLRQLPPDQIFAPENFGDGSASSNLFSFDAIKGNNFRYMANTILNAGFIQFDNQFTRELRVVWGGRLEHFDQLVGSVRKSDPRHVHSKVLDFLPGLNATYKLNNKTNLRLSASQTVIRPELRELSFLNLYDFELNASVQGNPNLKRSKNTNIDFRYELYPRAGEVFTAGVFYKYFKDPIEQMFNEGSGGASTFSYQNPEKAMAYGVEVEYRKRLDFVDVLRNFTLQANATYIYSRVEDPALQIDRPLQGQSPYLVNLGLMYDHEEKGLNATLLFNQIGHRIYLVGDLNAGAGSPDIYEAPRPLLDFQLSKKILDKKAEIRLNVSDIINRTQYFYQNGTNKTSFQKNEDAYRFTRRYGTSFSLTFNYTL